MGHLNLCVGESLCGSTKYPPHWASWWGCHAVEGAWRSFPAPNPSQKLCLRTLDDAYSDAGFIRNRGNASKLMRNTAIQSRVDELLQAKLPSNYTIRILHSGSGPHQLVPRRHAVERRRNGRRYNPQSVRSPLARAGPLKRHRLRAR